VPGSVICCALRARSIELPLIQSPGGWWVTAYLFPSRSDNRGLADCMTHRPNQLSGGQRQRVGIARAPVNLLPILLADEPTGNLDLATSQEILGLFDKLHADGQTIIMVTHEADVARHARCVVRMRDGKVLSDLPTEKDVVHA
jgi:putative ABC transport system ATP-binding protein